MQVSTLNFLKFKNAVYSMKMCSMCPVSESIYFYFYYCYNPNYVHKGLAQSLRGVDNEIFGKSKVLPYPGNVVNNTF